MNIYCYIGGGRVLHKDMDGVRRQLRKIVLKNKFKVGCAIIMPSLIKDKWINISKNLLKDLALKEIHIFDLEDEVKNIEKVKEADVIFFTGGLPDVFLEDIKITKNKFRSYLINKQKLIIGISAGALVLNEICFISRDKDYPKELILTGLNLRNDFICEVHFKGNITLMKRIFLKKKIVALEDNGTLIISDMQQQSIGKVHIYK